MRSVRHATARVRTGQGRDNLLRLFSPARYPAPRTSVRPTRSGHYSPPAYGRRHYSPPAYGRPRCARASCAARSARSAGLRARSRNGEGADAVTLPPALRSLARGGQESVRARGEDAHAALLLAVGRGHEATALRRTHAVTASPWSRIERVVARAPVSANVRDAHSAAGGAAWGVGCESPRAARRADV